MILTELKIHHLRNIRSADISLNHQFNVISGVNGSGKTSLLEALYLLSCGHSFREREIAPLISHGEPSFTVFARGSLQETISIQKSFSAATQVKLNNQFCPSTSQMAYALPCQIFYADIFHIIDAGPAFRRTVLDWGLFHVKHEYLPLFKQYKQVLKQRNALLKAQAPYTHFIPWDKQLSELGEQLHHLRATYFDQWQAEFALLLPQLSDLSCSMDYFKGWDKKLSGKTLEQTLEDSFLSDKQRGYTQHGAHQADILIASNDNKAKQFLSRGQQKIILFALKLAQANLLDKHCLYLIDDLPAELDQTHQDKLLKCLAHRVGQYVITTHDESLRFKVQELGAAVNYYQINTGVVKAG